MKIRKINILNKKDKKGISEIVGYLILVSIIIVMAGLVYTWLKSYVPKDIKECTEEVSISVDDYSYTKFEGSNAYMLLQLNLSNTGRFSIDGYYIKYGLEGQTIATNDISKSIIETSDNIQERAYHYVKFIDAEKIGENNIFEPGAKVTSKFRITTPSSSKKLEFIEILPVRYEEFEGKSEKANCGSARIQVNIEEEIVV